MTFKTCTDDSKAFQAYSQQYQYLVKYAARKRIADVRLVPNQLVKGQAAALSMSPRRNYVLEGRLIRFVLRIGSSSV